MIVCHICGAQNDPSNRFCDQCGARLDHASSHAAAGAAETGEQPAAVQPVTCSGCGAPALPGQAFCDNCGQDLRTESQAIADSNAPTEMAPHGVQPDEETVLADQTPLPPQPGAAAGADEKTVLYGGGDQIPAPDGAPAEQAEKTVLAPEPPPIAPGASPPAEEKTVLASPPPAGASPPPAEDKTVLASQPEEGVASPPPATEETILAPQPQPEQPPVSPPSPATITDDTTDVPKPGMTVDIPVDPEPEPQRKESIEEEIERHKATIQQMEQMIQAYPAGSVPTYLNQGLAEARQALEEAEQRLETMSSPAPAELARLEQLVDVHRGTIAQFEQMRTNYPTGSIPSFLEEGLKEARQALALVEAEITALREGKPVEFDSGKPKHNAGPRLELFDGKHAFPLPTDRTEFIVGREDPVSQIFPEVDLTSYGGEAGGVSRQHARINRSGNTWSVTDLDSTNHTRVDGERIEPNTPTPIVDGTKLQFGRIAAVFRLD